MKLVGKIVFETFVFVAFMASILVFILILEAAMA